ncbi:hypothetical protein KAJ27_03225 [bacterium]|nr:hypothetical protein [bacterium]
MKFRLVDRITDYQENKFIKGVKTVSLEEYFLHRPHGIKNLFPPTLACETLFQLANFLIFKSFPSKLGLLVMFRKIHFPTPVKAGDVINLTVRIKSIIEDQVMLDGVGFVGEKLVIEGKGCVAKLIDIEKLINPEKYSMLFDRLYIPHENEEKKILP